MREFSFVRPTPLTRAAALTILLVIGLSAAFAIWRYPGLPDLLPVHFKRNGYPNGWQYKTWPRVIMPVLAQLSLSAILGAVAALLLFRPGDGHHRADAPEVRAAAIAAEAVALMACVWVTFQAYAVFALIDMWNRGRAGLGSYGFLNASAAVLALLVGVRAHLKLGRPAPAPFVPEHWWLGHLYRNPADPALFVPTRDGTRWTLNFGRPLAAGLLGLLLICGAIVPAFTFALLLR
jgi:uncharacterized membrane protein